MVCKENNSKKDKFLFRLRSVNGVSQEKLGKSLGESQAQVSRWESEKYRLPAARLNEVRSALRLSWDQVVKELDCCYPPKKKTQQEK